jgi:hypothetical protein
MHAKFSLGMRFAEDLGASSTSLTDVIPAWIAGIQVNMDVSGASLRTWISAIHAGMTDLQLMDCSRV